MFKLIISVTLVEGSLGAREECFLALHEDDDEEVEEDSDEIDLIVLLSDFLALDYYVS